MIYDVVGRGSPTGFINNYAYSDIIIQNVSVSDTRYYHRAPPQNQQEKRAPKMKKPYKPEPSPESTTEQAAEEAPAEEAPADDDDFDDDGAGWLYR